MDATPIITPLPSTPQTLTSTPVGVPPAPTNTSGLGESTTLPPEIQGWSWGGFFLTWIWGIGNNVWIALLSFVPGLSFLMAIILGIKGREWAWKNKHWESTEVFKSTQKKWAIWGLILTILCFFPILLIAILATINPMAQINKANSVRNQPILQPN